MLFCMMRVWAVAVLPVKSVDSTCAKQMVYHLLTRPTLAMVCINKRLSVRQMRQQREQRQILANQNVAISVSTKFSTVYFLFMDLITAEEDCGYFQNNQLNNNNMLTVLNLGMVIVQLVANHIRSIRVCAKSMYFLCVEAFYFNAIVLKIQVWHQATANKRHKNTKYYNKITVKSDQTKFQLIKRKYTTHFSISCMYAVVCVTPFADSGFELD